MRPRVELKQDPTPEDRLVVFDLLEEYNASQVGDEPELPLTVHIYGDDPERVIGGLYGLTYYGWAFFELMFVPPHLRNQGVGTQVMKEAEAEAWRRGCHGVWIDTFTFQARGFYEKLGYSVFAEIPEYPPGHARLFLMKWLADATSMATR